MPNFWKTDFSYPLIRKIWRALAGSSKCSHWIYLSKFIGNNAKGRISKRVFQENRARQIFRKINISYPLIRRRTHTYFLISNNKLLQFKYILNYFMWIYHFLYFYPSRPNPGRTEKINSNFCFDAFKVFIKPFEAPQRSMNIKIYVNFYFYRTLKCRGREKLNMTIKSFMFFASSPFTKSKMQIHQILRSLHSHIFIR